MKEKIKQKVKSVGIDVLGDPNSRGITLIALIITIIVMLILVGVSVSIALNTGLFENARNVTQDWKVAQDTEQGLADGKFIEDYLMGEEKIPEFVDSIAQCTDITKKYVLPDGFLYEYVPEYTTSYTNQLPISIDESGNIFNDVGYKDGVRLSSSAAESSHQNSFITGYIPVEKGDTIRINGNYIKSDHTYSNSINNLFSNSDFTRIWLFAWGACSGSSYGGLTNIITNDEGYITQFTINPDWAYKDNWGDVAYMRLTLLGSGKDCIITVNEEITEPIIGEYKWQKTDKYVPLGWIDEIKSTVASVNSLKASEGSNAIQFLLTSDIHYPGNIAMTKNIGKVSAEVMEECDIQFFMNVGDSTTQSPGYSISDFETQINDVINNVLAPINARKILLTVGNHDGATGYKVVNGETLNYRYQLNNTERAKVFFDWQRTNTNKKFGPDGTYYYIDDVTTKTRYIMLNSFWTEWAGEEDGFTTDEQRSFFHNPLFGQTQLNWFANEALNMPSGYSAIIGTHCANSPKDTEVFKGILSAYKNRTTYSGSYTGEQTWQSSSISVDYSSAKGELVAIFHGHNHADYVNTTAYVIPYIGITTAGADVRDANPPTRIEGNPSETAIDVVTINKTNKTINITRLGVGEDRIISY